MKDKELEKVEKYQLLKAAVAKVWHVRKVIVVSVVIETLGAVSVNFKKCVKQIGVDVSLDGHAENSIAGHSKDTKKSTVPERRKKRETWDPFWLVVVTHSQRL